MRQAASYRAAAADCFMTDQGQSGRQQRHGVGDGLGFLGKDTRVMAPIATRPSVADTPDSSSTPLMSI